MDIVIEILLEVYMELMLLVIPEKNVSKKHTRIVKIVAICMALGTLALVAWGGVLIVDYHNLWGILPIVVAVIISLVQIITGIILYKKHH